MAKARGKTCRYHCSRCGTHFTSLAGFDAHHEGEGADHIPCQWPDLKEEYKWMEHEGTCRIGYGPVQNNVTIHELVRPGTYRATEM